jgi:hypothetical protein
MPHTPRALLTAEVVARKTLRVPIIHLILREAKLVTWRIGTAIKHGVRQRNMGGPLAKLVMAIGRGIVDVHISKLAFWTAA